MTRWMAVIGMRDVTLQLLSDALSSPATSVLDLCNVHATFDIWYCVYVDGTFILNTAGQNIGIDGWFRW